jgi:hypothetical protein
MLTSLPRTVTIVQDAVELRIEQVCIWGPMRLHILSFDRAGFCLGPSEYALFKRLI